MTLAGQRLQVVREVAVSSYDRKGRELRYTAVVVGEHTPTDWELR